MAPQQTGGRTKALLFFIGSLLAATLTAVLVANLIQQSREQIAEANKPTETVEVVVARRDLYIGLPITEEDVVIRQLSPDMTPGELAFTDVEEVLNRIPRERILANEILRAERLAQREAGIGLNAIIANGMRAMTVETDTESGLAGMLQPGNFVDVIVTIRPDDAEVQARWVTETILQGIRVLAVGETLSGAARTEEESSSRSNRRRQRPSVTLQLSLEEAEKLALASSKGDIHLVLRNDVDITQRDTHGPISTARMIGLGTESNQQSRTVTRQPDPSPQPITAEVIEGGTTIIESFDVDGNKINNRR